MATLDHVIPKALLRHDPNRDAPSNLVIACRRCNEERGMITNDIIKAGRGLGMSDAEIAHLIGEACEQ